LSTKDVCIAKGKDMGRADVATLVPPAGDSPAGAPSRCPAGDGPAGASPAGDSPAGDAPAGACRA